MKQNPLKQLFEGLKEIGAFKDYDTYEEYRRVKFKEDSPEETIEEREERFLDSLPEGEQKDFKYIFNS
jgi:hypothetical protein